ncbi:H/ACA ribonucleoprotein complex subunit 2-like protein [Pecten maximus]|uniref:H/ACA ribonucleoprotein complex subunit 2-like protein n=1 Tax=Pecten maximus TaxID=6579 RepID=UPI0014585377|nr:H/ACA ribonucleoprotein complex subunit 2-like protein [Pecten maximus]
MGKDKKRKSEGGDEEGGDSKESWNSKIEHLNAISKPLAPRKLSKRLYKAIKKAAKQKQLRKGVREVQKFVRKGEKGVIVLAGDVSPVDVICHMPLLCEEGGIPYCYTPSKDDLGSACGSKRPTCMVMIKPHDDYRELYDECFGEVKDLPLPI